MEMNSLYDPYAIHFSTFAGDVYTLSTASLTLTAGTLTADTLTDGTLSISSGSITSGVNATFSGALTADTIISGPVSITGNLTVALTGTVGTINGQSSINGTNTLFLTELAVGDAIKIESDVGAGYEIFTVASITNDISLTLDSNSQGSNSGSLSAWTDPDLFTIVSGDSVNFITVNKTGNLVVDTTTLVVDAVNHRVGMGTASPGAKFELSDSGFIDLIRLTRAGVGSVNLRIGNIGGGSVTFDWRLPTADSRLAVRGAMSVGSSYADSALPLNNGMAIQGSVGIGTKTPQSILHVSGSEAGPLETFQLSNTVAAGVAGQSVIFNVKTLADYSGQMGAIVFKRIGTYATAGTSISSMEFYTAVGNVDTLALTIDEGQNVTLENGLIVDTPTLVVDEVNHNVGIGLTTIDNNYKLIIRRAANVNLGIGLQSSELAIAAFNDALSANIPMRFYASEYNLLNGSVGINTDTPDTKLQVVGTAGFGDDSGNETLFSATGDMSFAGDATVWNDMQFQISDAKVTPASLLPSWEAFTANTSEYAFGVNKEVDTSANELPHSWKEGTSGHAHMHITTKAVPAQEEKAQFTVTFAYADTAEVWVEAPLTAELTIPISTTALTNFYLDLGDITLTNYLIEAQMRCRVKRIPKSAGGTEYTGDIFITQIGIHFEEDMVGSRTEITK